MKKYTLNDINCILVDYINENSNYFDRIETLKDLLKEIEKEYKQVQIETLDFNGDKLPWERY